MQKGIDLMSAVETFMFEPQLASTPSNLTINYFYKAYVEGALVLRPPFQRNMVWNPQQQSFLVDSILRGLPVPEIYVQTETSAEGEERTIIVDGQQRISACIEFIDGALRLSKDDELDQQWKGRTFSELDPDLRRRFRSYELIARKLPNVNDSVLREIFRRLNKTVEPLEPQELRHAAYTGPFIQFIEDAGRNPIFTEIGVFSSKDYLRRRNDELIAEIAYAITSKAFPNKKEGLDELFLTYERQGISGETINDLQRRFGRVFATLGTNATTLRRTRFRNKSDFYSLFVYLGKNAETLPLDSASEVTFIDRVKDFSDRVNDIKKREAEGRSIDDLTADELGTASVKYLRSVERAASDRLSRVRREESLRVILDPIVTAGGSNKLSEADAEWRSSTEESESESDEPLEEGEREHTREVLLRDA
jgi:Protein of unknown function DUF262